MKIKITLTEEMLGTKAADKDVFATYIASKAPDGDKRREEIETAESREEAGTTIFHQQNGKIGIWDYQVKGFFKDACGSLRNADGTMSRTLTAYKTRIDQLFFVKERFIPLVLPQGEKVGICERPLRCETMQGPRVSLARSETVPAGTSFTIEIICLSKKIGKGEDGVNSDDLLEEWLNYGALRGLGQWRNSGKGRFSWELVEF